MENTGSKLDRLEWRDADSSAVSRIAYDSINNHIYVEFTRGAVYRYDDCDQSVWTAMNDHGSVGSFVHNNLSHHTYFEVTGS